jgi:hypothetical protein
MRLSRPANQAVSDITRAWTELASSAGEEAGVVAAAAAEPAISMSINPKMSSAARFLLFAHIPNLKFEISDLKFHISDLRFHISNLKFQISNNDPNNKFK